MYCNRDETIDLMLRVSSTSKMVVFLTCKGLDHKSISKLLNRSYSSTRKAFNNVKRSLYFRSLPDLVCSFYETGMMTEPVLSIWYKEHPTEEVLNKVRGGEIDCLSDLVE